MVYGFFWDGVLALFNKSICVCVGSDCPLANSTKPARYHGVQMGGGMGPL
jgi:hypothetical protein